MIEPEEQQQQAPMATKAQEITAEIKAATKEAMLNPREFRANHEDPAAGGNGDEPQGNPIS